MNPSSTLRVRRLIATLAVGWAALAIFLALSIFLGTGDRIFHPFLDTRVGTTVVVQTPSPRAAERGVAPGDLVREMNGEPYVAALRRGPGALREGVSNTYVFEKPDARRLTLELPPEPVAWSISPLTTSLHALLVLVAAIYLVTGGAAWWLKPERADAFALLLFCSAMASQLATTLYTDFIPAGWPRMAINVPLIGATTFHLFTTYPIEPVWIVRHRRIRIDPLRAWRRVSMLTRSDCEPMLLAGSSPGSDLVSTLAWASTASGSSLALARHPVARSTSDATLEGGDRAIEQT